MNNRIIRLFSLFIAIVLLSPIKQAVATIPEEEVAIGGITYRCPISKVLDKYGPPLHSKDGKYYWKANSLFINTWSATKGRTNYVTEVKSSSNNGIETPAGIKVGMSEMVLNQAYGQADDVFDNDIHGYIVYVYNSSNSGSLAFRVNRGVIKSIEIAGSFI